MSYEIDCISDKTKWKSVKVIGRIVVHRIEQGKEKITKHYYILSNKFDINAFVKITREH